MKHSVTVLVKRQFIGWFLNRYELQKKEAAWLLSYLSSDDQLLKKVHFVENVRYLPKSMILSTKCTSLTPFKYVKYKRVGADVETAFYDIRSYPKEELYISLYFRDRETCPEYAAVLEGNPMEKQDLVKNNMLGLFAEMFLDNAVLDFRRKQLYIQIDQALAQKDRTAFLQLSEQWRKLIE
ncbi:Uncharacterized protein YpiB, UPF0302 family [Seinonella peptonophila]|uniref:Uncharacterized protein YpiB, UPF0302 family n=1 Tax=Seinonella peptonophila TaxID=112248 RepID=A0A1M4TEF7_9BACL|nr:ReoY family proteolytic degradation factor [Seinonella peptonophila]SHE42836.1 Uncharacterized protein YpiB, UPF0302 family [Seinonella peptonophila]